LHLGFTPTQRPSPRDFRSNKIQSQLGVSVARSLFQAFLERGGSAPKIAGLLGLRTHPAEVRQPTIVGSVGMGEPLIRQRFQRGNGKIGCPVVDRSDPLAK